MGQRVIRRITDSIGRWDLESCFGAVVAAGGLSSFGQPNGRLGCQLLSLETESVLFRLFGMACRDARQMHSLVDVSRMMAAFRLSKQSKVGMWDCAFSPLGPMTSLSRIVLNRLQTWSLEFFRRASQRR